MPTPLGRSTSVHLPPSTKVAEAADGSDASEHVRGRDIAAFGLRGIRDAFDRLRGGHGERAAAVLGWPAMTAGMALAYAKSQLTGKSPEETDQAVNWGMLAGGVPALAAASLIDPVLDRADPPTLKPGDEPMDGSARAFNLGLGAALLGAKGS